VLRAWRSLLEAHRRLADALDDELMAQHGFGLQWYDVLVQLAEAGGRLRMSELAEATLFSRTDCTRIVDRMGRRGLVERQSVPEDGRGVYAVLTPAGRATLREASETHLDGIERRFGAHLDDAGADALHGLLVEIGRASIR
jgi:DNA-binding MarR family transcriptional regulator